MPPTMASDTHSQRREPVRWEPADATNGVGVGAATEGGNATGDSVEDGWRPRATRSSAIEANRSSGLLASARKVMSSR